MVRWSCVFEVITGPWISRDVASALWVQRLPVLVQFALMRGVPHHLVVDVDEVWSEACNIAELDDFLWYCVEVSVSL